MVGFAINILDPVLNPLLVLPPWAVIMIMALFVTIIITLAYKFMTNQNLMKSLKDDMKKTREKMKRYKNEPDKMLAIQKEAMDKQMQYMMHSLRPTLITFIPIIFLFGWLNAHLAFVPLAPDTPFEVTAYLEEGVSDQVTLSSSSADLQITSAEEQDVVGGSATWELTGPSGVYTLNFIHGDTKQSHDILITEQYLYEQPEKKYGEGSIVRTEIGNEKLALFHLFGFGINWLIAYIIFSIVFSISLRRLLRIH